MALEVKPLAERVVQGYQWRAQERGLSLRGVASGMGKASANPQALERVLVNLLENAFKYTDAGGSVEVRVEASPERTQISVVDTGIGIPEAEQSRIFERFYRVDKARSRELGGTGPGLAIVRHLVQGMGGEIRVESREGEGSCFRCSLPGA